MEIGDPSCSSAMFECWISKPSTMVTILEPITSRKCPSVINTPVSSPNPMPMQPGLLATAWATRPNHPRLSKCESMITFLMKASPVVIFTSPLSKAPELLP